MITNTFDPATTAKLNPFINPDAVKVDACIITFSYVIEKFVRDTYDCEQIGESKSVTGNTPIYLIRYKRFTSHLSARPRLRHRSRTPALSFRPTNISFSAVAAVLTARSRADEL